MEGILFIINPIAGKGRTKQLIPLIEETMENTKKYYKIITTNAPKQAVKIANYGSLKGFKTIVAVGGDGTVNEVATGIFNHGKSTLGIIPSGTGNDLARTLNIPMDPKKALKIILKGKSKKIDVGFVNNTFFLNVASVGLDSEIVKNTQKIKKHIKGKIAYIFGLFNTLFGFKDKNIEIELDDLKINEDIMLAAVGNGKYYGGGMKICPMATIEDGYFHLCIIKKVSKIKLFVLFPLVFLGFHGKFKKYVKFYKTKKIKMKLYDKNYLNIDGEITEINKEISFIINDKKRINVFCE